MTGAAIADPTALKSSWQRRAEGFTGRGKLHQRRPALIGITVWGGLHNLTGLYDEEQLSRSFPNIEPAMGARGEVV